MHVHKKQTYENFKKFHGRPPEKKTSIEFTMPQSLTFLGGGYSIKYESDKPLYRGHGRTPSGRTPVRKKRLYEHQFGPGVKIYLHPNRRWLIIGGGKFRVTDWMRD